MKRKKGKILPIRIVGDKILRQKARLVERIDPEIKEFVYDLIETMYEKDGVGLAAPQVGKSIRIFVVDPFWFKEGYEKEPKVFINPVFKEFNGESEGEEGCLSLPDIYAHVTRAENVQIEALNEKGEKVKYQADGLFARALQHEYDHLEGILFIDKVSKLKRISFSKKLKELKKNTNEKGENISY